MRGISPEIKEAQLNLQFLARTAALMHCLLFKKRNPHQLHFLRQFRSCPENIAGEGLTTGQTAV